MGLFEIEWKGSSYHDLKKIGRQYILKVVVIHYIRHRKDVYKRR